MLILENKKDLKSVIKATALRKQKKRSRLTPSKQKGNNKDNSRMKQKTDKQLRKNQ